MIELYELRQFAAFGETGTLSEAAEKLHLSQPAISRNMKKLENDLGVTLFERTKNKISLNDNGRYLLELTQKLLSDANYLPVKVREHDRKKHTISLGVCAPAPIWRLASLIANSFPQMTLQTEIDDDKRLLSDLGNGIYQLIVLHEKPESNDLIFKECGRESLMFALPKEHRFADRKSLCFDDMDGENMLLMPNLGFWDFVKNEKMTKTRFLTQSDRYSFNELVQASSLPCFTSDMAEKFMEIPSGRVKIPVSDNEATVIYYLVCMAERKKEFEPLFRVL